MLVSSAVAETREINWGVASASTSVFGDLLAKSFILAVALSISLAVTSEQHLSFGGEFAKTATLLGLRYLIIVSYYWPLSPSQSCLSRDKKRCKQSYKAAIAETSQQFDVFETLLSR